MNTKKGSSLVAHTPLAISRTSNVSTLQTPVLNLDSAVLLSIPSHKESYDPFLVKSPQPPPRGDHMVTMKISPSSSYDIEITPGSSDEIEEIMVISKKTLPHISTLHDVFHLIAPLGSGVAADIFLAGRHDDSQNRLFAIKRMRKSIVLSDDFAHDPLSEQLALKTVTLLNCPFLPTLYASFTDERYLYLVTDFCARGDLLTYLMRDGAFDPDATLFYAGELVLAIDSLHHAGIVHRDLKPENVLIDISGHLVVTDFGCAKLIQPGSSRWIETSFCGTKEYLAPEMALEWAHDFSVDIWGFGILVYLLAFAQHPFMSSEEESDDSTTIRRKILLSPTMPPRDSMDHDGSPLANLIGQCLERNAGLRPKISDVKNHTYFSTVNWQLLASRQIPVPPSRVLDGSNIFTPSGSIESFSSQHPQEISDSLTSGTSPSLNNLDLASFSFRWDLGLDCEDEDGSVSDYGTVMHTGETNLSAPLTTATCLSAVEEITEGGLTDSVTPSTTNQLSLSVPPSDNELGLLPPQLRKDLKVKKDSKSVLGRLRLAGNRLVPRLSIPCAVLTSTPPVVKVQANPSEKPSEVLHPRPKNKLRKKTRPSIAITLAVDPVSSFSLAQPLARSLEGLQAGTNFVSVSPVVGFPSARSFFSFELPPVFSKARFKALQRSKYRPSNDVGVTYNASTANTLEVDSAGSSTREFGGRISEGGQMGGGSERVVSADVGVGGFPTPIRSDSDNDQRASTERASTRRRSRLTSWERGLGLMVRSLFRAPGGAR